MDNVELYKKFCDSLTEQVEYYKHTSYFKEDEAYYRALIDGLRESKVILREILDL